MLLLETRPPDPGGRVGGPEQGREHCRDVANLAGADTDEGALSRLIYAEASLPNEIGSGSQEQADEMNAIAAVVNNRVGYLGQPGLRQSQTLGWGNVGASVSDVVYSRGRNPNGESNISVQFAGFSPSGISSPIQGRINGALNSNADSDDCLKLLSAITAARNPGPDPFLFQGSPTFGMRTRGSDPLGAPHFAFPDQIRGSGNVFYGFRFP